tara:strand:- start:7078 stop:8346 length:1269 start_codon:yes stop_codon:yes gene_type:complete
MSFDVFKHQEEFVKTTAKFPALVAGYGSGKTLAFCLKGILELGRNPGKTILLAEPVFPMIRDVLQPTLEQLLDDLNFRYQYKASESKYNIYWKNGSGCIILRSAENWRRWAGLNLAAFGIDEAALLKDDSAWKMGISRLRDGIHFTGFTTTTPEGFNWHYEYWKENPKDEYQLIHGKTTDNKFLPQEFIDTLKANYDATLIRAYLNGEYVNLQHGQAYYNFVRSKNVKEVKYDNNRGIRVCIDFNVSPMCAVLLQVYDTSPKIRVFDEIRISHGGAGELMTERLAQEVKRKYPNNRYIDVLQKRLAKDTYICYPDPAGSQRRTSARLTDHDILRKEGFMVKVKRQAPRVIDRLNSVNNSFKEVAIDPRCKELIKDFERVVIKEGTRELDKTDLELTHMSDAFGYFVDFEFPVRKPQTKSFMA